MNRRAVLAQARSETTLGLRRGESLVVTIGIPVGVLLFFGRVSQPTVDGDPLAFLVPGIGAQGGDLAAVLGSGPAIASPAGGRAGGGLLVNVSRAIAGAAAAGAAATGTAPGTGADVEERLAAAAREWAARTPVVP